MAEVEQAHQVADRRAVSGHVGIVTPQLRIGQVVGAALGHRRQPPVALDELEHRDVVGVGVVDRPRAGVRRDREHRHPGAVAEEGHRLDVPQVVVAAALVEGDQDGGVGEELRLRHHPLHHVAGEVLEQRQGGVAGVAVVVAGLHEGDRGQAAGGDRGGEVVVAVEVGALRRAGHDRGGVLHRVADPAVLGGRPAVVPAHPVVAPGDPPGRQRVTDGAEPLRRDGEVVGTQRGWAAVGEVAGIVVVEQVVGAVGAVTAAERMVLVQERADRPHPRLRAVRAVRVAAPLVAVLGEVVVRARLGVGILDLVLRRPGRVAGGVLMEGGVAGAEHDVIGAGAPHHRLVIVVGAGVVVGEEAQHRRVAVAHAVVAHLQAALVDRVGRDRAVVEPRGVRGPDPEVVAAAVHLLPHLVEAVDGVAGVRAVGDVAGDPVRAVGQAGGEPRVRDVRGQPLGGGGVGPGQRRVRHRPRRRQPVDVGVGGPALHRALRPGTAAATGGDDPL